MRGRVELAGPETIALKALAYLVDDSEAFERFMVLSGTDATSVRSRAEEVTFLAAVLDYLLANESLLIAFCETRSLEPRTIHLAAARLGG